MQKKLLAFFVTLLVTVNLSAQITLTQSSYPSSLLGTDSIANTTATSSFPTLTSMTEATWDMTTITDTTIPSFAYRVAGAYEFADSNYYSLGSYSYQGNVQSSITTTGLLEYGIIIPRAAYSLSSWTLGPTDSLIILSQDNNFSTPHIVIAFPATNNTIWSSTYQSAVDYQLSISLSGYNHAPGVVKSYITETDTVKGYGKMRVKNLAGVSSSYFNVLQVQKTTTTIDSFFLNGSLASHTLLTELGLNQGQSTTTYYQDYYRPEEVTPLAEVQYPDATFSHPKSAATHVQRLVNEGVTNIADDSKVSIYPNPVKGGVVSINLPAAVTGSWSYELIDRSGKTVHADVLKTNNGHAVVTLPASITPGIYYIRLNNNNSQFCVKPIEII